MTMLLHVSNVPLDATEEGLRRHFSTCGGVADVELLYDRRTNLPRGLARVRMTSEHFAEQARIKLDGAAFGDAVLRVGDSAKTDAEPKSKVKILQQFRERSNMVYDLDCAGAPLTLRISRDEQGLYCVEARSTEAADAIVARGSAATGVEALAEALRLWNVAAAATPRLAIDADAVTRAIRDVRAI